MNEVYADHAASTPLRPEVREAMEPHWGSLFGNASSTHRWGRRVKAALEDARASLAAAIGAEPAEIVFTRGGTEANNLALVGTAGLAASGAPLVLSAFEHKAVLDTADAIDAPVIHVPVRAGTGLDLGALEAALSHSPALVSVMWVNNETGDVQPLAEAVALSAKAGVPLHTDGVQAVGKIAVDVRDTPVDLMTMTGHKLGGPTSAGALFVREGHRLEPMLRGGGQERGLRPGTQDVAGAVGLAAAIRLATAERESKTAMWDRLRVRLLEGLRREVPELSLYGVGLERAPHIVNVGIPGFAPDALIAALDLEGVAASGGSACASGSAARSYVLEAIHGGVSPESRPEPAEGPLNPPPAPVRFSFGWTSTEEEVDFIVAAVARISGRITAGSPASV